MKARAEQFERRRVCRAAVVVAGCALVLAGCADDAPSPSGEAEIPSAEAEVIDDGRAIAEEQCAGCHAIGGKGASPNRQAPPFRTVLSRYDARMLEAELIEGMRVAHEPMPQFRFNPLGASALIAYLRSIQVKSPGQAFVEARCGRCHATGNDDISPYPGAQPFRNLGRRWRRDQLADALRTGIIAEHDASDVRLPPMKLNERELADFFRYLDALASAENPAPRSYR